MTAKCHHHAHKFTLLEKHPIMSGEKKSSCLCSTFTIFHRGKKIDEWGRDGGRNGKGKLLTKTFCPTAEFNLPLNWGSAKRACHWGRRLIVHKRGSLKLSNAHFFSLVSCPHILQSSWEMRISPQQWHRLQTGSATLVPINNHWDSGEACALNLCWYVLMNRHWHLFYIVGFFFK